MTILVILELLELVAEDYDLMERRYPQRNMLQPAYINYNFVVIEKV